MILPIGKINSNIYYEKEEVARKLLALGLSPTGNLEIDKSRLRKAEEKKVEKFELQEKETFKDEQSQQKERMEEERLGALNLAELNKIYHHIA